MKKKIKVRRPKTVDPFEPLPKSGERVRTHSAPERMTSSGFTDVRLRELANVGVISHEQAQALITPVDLVQRLPTKVRKNGAQVRGKLFELPMSLAKRLKLFAAKHDASELSVVVAALERYITSA